MLITLRLPARFFSHALDTSWFFFTIHFFSVVIALSIISLYRHGEVLEATKVFFIALYSITIVIILYNLPTDVFDLFYVLLIYIFDCKLTLLSGTGTGLKIEIDTLLSTGCSGNGSGTTNNSSGSNNSSSGADSFNHIPKVLHPRIPDPQLPQLPLPRFLHPQLGNPSVGLHTSVATNPGISVNPALDLSSFSNFAASLESRCRYLSHSKPALRSGIISITLSDLGIKKNSPEWNKLAEAFPKPNHESLCFANSLRGNNYGNVVI